MKALVLTTEIGADGGGLAKACCEFIGMLENDLGIETSVVKVSLPPSDVYIAEGGYDPDLKDRLAREYALKLALSEGVDVQAVVSFGASLCAFMAACLSESLQVPLYVLLRGSDINMGKWDGRSAFLTSVALRRASAVVSLSREMLATASLIEPTCSGKGFVIPNPISKPNGVRLPGPDKSPIVLGTNAAHLNEKKGVANQISMMAHLKRLSSRDYELRLAGAIDQDLLQRYEELAEALDVDGSIRFIGPMPREDLLVEMESWDFYLQASISEGQGNAVSECIEMGLPVILSRTGYYAENLSATHGDILFPSFTGEPMAEHIERIAGNCEQMRESFNRAYASLYDSANRERVTDAWRRVFGLRATHAAGSDSRPFGMLTVALHDVQGDLHDGITTPIGVFARFVEDVSSYGYRLCSFERYLSASSSERERSIVCTFDDAYVGVLDNALPIMAKHGFDATVFACSGLLGSSNAWNNKDSLSRRHMSIGQLRELKSRGWEIGSHGIEHQNLLKLSDDELALDLSESKSSLERYFGKVRTYAYPYGAYNEVIMNRVAAVYDYAFTLSSGGCSIKADSHRLKRYTITEIYTILRMEQ